MTVQERDSSTRSSAEKKPLRTFLRCYARPEQDGVLAVCVDLNVHAFGVTLAQAQSNLHEAIRNTIEVAHQSGHLEELLSQGPNRETMRDYRATMVIYTVARTLLGIFRFVAAARDFCASLAFSSWEERACA